MTPTQRRKFTLALNGFLQSKRRFQFSWNMDARLRSRRNTLQLAKRKHLYRVVEELVKEGK